MGAQKDGASSGRLSLPLPLLLLLLGSLPSPVATQALGYQEAVRQAVADFNQRSLDPSLFRLLSLDSTHSGDEHPGTPKPVSFTVKETVCPKATQLPLEQCDFKENGVVKRCTGTVALGPASSASDVSCDRAQRVRRMVGLRKFLRKTGRKLRKTLQKIGNALQKFQPRPQFPSNYPNRV